MGQNIVSYSVKTAERQLVLGYVWLKSVKSWDIVWLLVSFEEKWSK